MSRRISLSLALALLAGGCAPGNPALQVMAVLKPDNSCIISTSNIQLSSGVLDVRSSTVSYSVTALVSSQLLNLGESGTSGPPASDPNLVSLIEAEVELRDASGATLALGGVPNPYRVPASGIIPSTDGNSTSSAVGTMQVIPPAVGEALRSSAGGSIVVSFRLVGSTAGGSEVVSPPYQWSMALCDGCLFGCQHDSDGVPACVPSCRPGQDEVTISPAVCDGVAASCLATAS